MTTDTIDPRVAAAELLCEWALADNPDLAREFGIDEFGMIDGAPINTPEQSRSLHSAIAAAATGR